MAVKTKEELMNMVKSRLGDDTGDEALGFLDDLSDTLDDLEKKSNGDGEDWKKKYEENDAQWRQKYRDRFFSGESVKDEEEQTEPPKNEPQLKTNFEELFEKE